MPKLAPVSRQDAESAKDVLTADAHGCTRILTAEYGQLTTDDGLLTAFSWLVKWLPITSPGCFLLWFVVRGLAVTEPGELDAVRPYFRGVDRVVELPRGSFIGYNRESGAELAGKLF